MKIELKSIDYNKSLSESAYAFAAKIYIDGKYIADVSNRGRDMVNTIEPIKPESVAVLKQAEKFCASHYGQRQPAEQDLTAYLYLEQYVDALMLEHLNRKNDQKMDKEIKIRMLNGLVYGNKEGTCEIIRFKYSMQEILASSNGPEVLLQKLREEVLPELKKGDKLLNTNVPEALILQAGFKPDQYVKPGFTESPQNNIKPTVAVRKKPWRL
ncbi:hypothetical protein [Chitinophaga defluvii]|uniref:Uncharacterized protein n=1 Tax=Chitinophaga defluvii TaxID=3163343 RepID=A0ABV2TCH1_9BACT